MKRTHIPQLLFTAILVSTALLGCSAADATETPDPASLAATFSGNINATGVIVPEQFASLSVAAAGVVESVTIREGDLVESGALLVQIKGGEQAKAAIAAAEFELTNARIALNNLYEDTDLMAANALKTAKDTEEALENLLDRELHQALALQTVADIEKLIENTERSYNYAINTADQADVDVQRAQVTLAKDALDKAIEDFEPYEDKPEDNLVRAAFLQKKAAAQQVYDNAVRRLNALLGTGSEADIAVASANLSSAQAQLIKAQRDLERVQEGPNPGEVALLETQIKDAYEDYEIFQSGPDPDHLAAAEARVANAEAQLGAAQAALDNLQLTAPFDGVVSALNINPNEWVSPGQPIMTFADLSSLRIETTDLSEIDVAKLQVGHQAEVSFDAFPDLVLTGTVTRISPMASPGSGVNYTVVVELDEMPENLRWGMTVFVDIDPQQ
ncbi:MAG: efflux RND transporter periplasmic adaptor subunit [Chloroflexota bacterium]